MDVDVVGAECYFRLDSCPVTGRFRHDPHWQRLYLLRNLKLLTGHHTQASPPALAPHVSRLLLTDLSNVWH